MFLDLFKRNKKEKEEKELVGSVIVSPSDFDEMITLSVPIRCKDGTVVVEKKQINLAVKNALDALFMRFAFSYEEFVEIEKRGRKKAGKTKVVAKMKVLCNQEK